MLFGVLLFILSIMFAIKKHNYILKTFVLEQSSITYLCNIYTYTCIINY